MPPHRSGDSAIDESWDLITSRIRDLMRNDPVMKSAKRGLAKGVIGGFGIQTFSEAIDENREPLDEFDEESDDLFEEWCEADIDIEGRMSWAQIQWNLFNETMETGEALLLECWDDDPDRLIPLCYQVLEAEQIDETRNWDADETNKQFKCRRGIEYDKRNRPVAYWLFDENPYDSFGGYRDAVRTPASRVIHCYLPSRASQHRGITWFSANMQNAKDIDWYLGNELTAAALGALLTAYVKRKNGGGNGSGFITGSEGQGTSENRKFKLARGTVAELGPDDEVGVIESSRPNRDAAPFIKFLLMMQGMGIGLSPLRLTGDYSQASYTSARGAHLDDQAYFAVLQQWAAGCFVRTVRQRFTRHAAAKGLFKTIRTRDFQRNERRYQRVAIQPPGREQLDPEAETGAAMDRVRSKLSTHQIECGLRGHNWRRIARQAKREQDYFERLGIEPDVDHTAAFLARREERRNPNGGKTKELEYATHN